MNLIKKYELRIAICRNAIAKNKKIKVDTSYLEGSLDELKTFLLELKKQALNDRFFLEEIVYAIEKGEDDKVFTLTRDFLSEYVSNLPLSEFERESYIKDILGHSDLEYYFKSEKELKFFLKNNNLPDNYLEDFSIVDCSSKDEQ